MLTKRIIPCLDIKDGRTVKGTNFVNLRDAGDPVALAAVYAEQGADELVFLDITATVDERKTLIDLVRNVAHTINIPFTVGGGISSIADVSALLNAGADKISINSSAVRNPDLVDELEYHFDEKAFRCHDAEGPDMICKKCIRAVSEHSDKEGTDKLKECFEKDGKTLTKDVLDAANEQAT